MLQAEDTPSSVGSRSSGFTGRPFWQALQQSNVEREVRTLFYEARQAVRRKGAIPLLVIVFSCLHALPKVLETVCFRIQSPCCAMLPLHAQCD